MATKTNQPWTQQAEQRVLVRGRATAELKKDAPKTPAAPKAAKIDQLNQA